MKIKALIKSVFIFSFFLFATLANANEGESEKKITTDPKKEKAKASSVQKNTKGSPSTEGIEENKVSADSLEDQSLSKYNFIFHFLYKFKYDYNEQETGA
ncbi:MAG: hypothetical protein AAF616_00615 [Bacteroidota bacterium]